MHLHPHGSRWTLVLATIATLSLAACGATPIGATPSASESRDAGSPVASASSDASGVPPRPTDLPADGSCEENRVCLGVLDAGRHEVEHFDPPFTFAVADDGWVNPRASGGVVLLVDLRAPGDELDLYQRAVPRTYDNKLVAGIGHSAAEFVGWLTERSDLSVTDPEAATVGGLDGWWMDVSVAADATGGPQDCPTRPCVIIAGGADPAEMPTWGWDHAMWLGSASRIYALEAASGTVLIVLTAWDGAGLDATVARMQPVLDSIEFAEPATSP